jgi:hypothetical protein
MVQLNKKVKNQDAQGIDNLRGHLVKPSHIASLFPKHLSRSRIKKRQHG